MHPSSPPRAPRPPSTSLTGPVLTTVAGAVLCALTLVVALLVARSFTGLLPTGLLATDGSPGPEVVGVVEVPGSAEVDLVAGTAYTLWLLRPGPGQDTPAFDGDIQVAGPDGEPLPPSVGPTVSGTVGLGGQTAVTVDDLTTTTAGTYTVTVPPLADGGPATVLIAPAQPFLPFFTGLFGTVAGVFVAIAAALLGVPMLVLGVVWWRSRRRARTTTPGPGAPAPTG